MVHHYLLYACFLFYSVYGIINYVNNGTSTVLRCPFKGIYWYVPPDLTLFSNRTQILSPRSTLNLTGDIFAGEYNLQIINIQDKDEGEYQCIGFNESHNITLIITEPPTYGPVFSKYPLNDVTEGELVSVRCLVVGGKPLANITLYCDRHSNSQEFSNNTAKISELSWIVNRTDNFILCYCISSNPVWWQQVVYNLTVLYVPHNYPSIQQTPSGPVITGNNVTLTCVVFGGNPLAVLSWNCSGSGSYTNNTARDKSSYSVTLTVNEKDNNKICICSATHVITSYKPKALHKIIVYYAPYGDLSISQIPPGPVFSGTNIILICSVTGGNPLAILKWDCSGTYTNKTVQNIVSYSVLLTVNKTDNNRLCTCSATHPISSFRPTQQHRLIVYYAPDINPSIYQSPSEPVISGNNVTLTCEVFGGHPLALLSWDCIGSNTNNTAGNTASYSVTLTVNKYDNNKICTCSATHVISSYNRTVQHAIVVYYLPDVGPIIQQAPVGSIVSGNRVTLTCKVSGGNPLATLSLNCTGSITNNTTENTASYSVTLIVNASNHNRICACSASHPIKSYMAFAQHRLAVYYPPDVEPIIQQAPPGVLLSGNKVKLTCIVPGGNPLATLTWNCTGIKINNTSDNTASYSVDLVVNLNDHDKICTCSATHPDTSYRPFVLHRLAVYYGINAGGLMNDNSNTVLNAGIAMLVISSLLIIATVSIIFIYRMRARRLHNNSSSRNYTDISTTNPVFTETYDTLDNNTPSKGQSEHQRPKSCDAYEDIKKTVPSKQETGYQNVQNFRKGATKKKDGLYANI